MYDSVRHLRLFSQLIGYRLDTAPGIAVERAYEIEEIVRPRSAPAQAEMVPTEWAQADGRAAGEGAFFG